MSAFVEYLPPATNSAVVASLVVAHPLNVYPVLVGTTEVSVKSASGLLF